MLYAGDFPTMFPDGREWICVRTGDPFFMKDEYFTISVCGDTIVDGLSCRKLKAVYENSDNEYCYVVHENNGKVYCLGTDKEKASDLLLDFSMRCGDKYQLDEYMDMTVTAEDSIEVNGVKRRRLIINDDYQWVEGIGSDTDDSWLFVQYTYWGIYSYIESCYDNGELVFSKDDFKAAPTDGIKDVTNWSEEKYGKMFDISGKPLSEPENGQVYIKNHRKYIKR